MNLPPFYQLLPVRQSYILLSQVLMRTFFLPGSPNLEETCYGSELACRNPFSQQRLESSSNRGPDLLRQVSIPVLVFLLLFMAENRELPVSEESLSCQCSLSLKNQIPL